ncbi:MAG: lipopolysaccharide biosynthesis protein [Sphingobium sp.]
MLFRQTMLFLPAQLLPALCQFGQLIVWSHLVRPEVIGVVALFTSIQEFLNLAFIGFWTQYTTRYSTKLRETPGGAEKLRYASTAVIFGSLLIQTSLALGIYVSTIDHGMDLPMALALIGLVGGRAINLFQGELARARQDVLGYSFAVMAGPVFGFLVGLVLIWQFGGSALLIFTGFAVAQIGGVLVGMWRDPRWIGIGKPDWATIRHAISYGFPLVVTYGLAWVSQNASRIAVTYFMGLAAAGIYSLGMGLGYRASMVSTMMVNAAAFPIAVKLANAGNLKGAQKQLGDNGALLFGVLAASIVGLAVLSEDVFHLMVAKEVRGPVLPVMLWSLLAGSLIGYRQHFLNQFFLLSGKTRPIAVVSTIEAVVAVVLAIAVVPIGGITGGAIALTATSAISLVVTFVMAGKVGRHVRWDIHGKIVIATLVMVAAIWLTPPASNIVHLSLRIAVGGIAYLGTLAVLFSSVLLPKVNRWRAARSR